MALCYGECVPDLVRCTDTDGGLDVDHPGVVTYVAPDGTIQTLADTCGEHGLIIEAYCFATPDGGRLATVSMYCNCAYMPNGGAFCAWE